MTTRKRRNHLTYAKYTGEARRGNCQFCDFASKNDEVVGGNSHLWIVRNIFPYDIWDTSSVEDHLLVIPKRHVDSIAHFDSKEQVAYVALLAEYEAKGYSVYARAPSNKMKSVTHQHTHLMKLGEHKDSVLFIRKPYLLISK